ncbi:hypothetical protein ROZALSC1DRAFT_30703 [Rozella allomycis CSF55]|uniref:Uncharacterized protein n=1 Tax=Rozella allomycis (strain CSF55) TaxID=988480 RepID=A0A075AQH9_ROZAC|nr:hypothetical protein O9G_001322 [Rozella allomycis CSF55]RKP17494.1 hypothetical protein ROZALSC1DRAFT_30703 [Rozella allomycis CSF55]|eukprot:EPZ32420.1 hypothetical protein O9G_001322 [Rozella allomycis CSF55]
MGCIKKDKYVPSCAIHNDQNIGTCQACEIDATLIDYKCFRKQEGCKKPKGLFQCDECGDPMAKAEGDICVPKIDGCKSYAKDGSCSDCGDNFRSQNKMKCYPKPKDCDNDKIKEENGKVTCSECKNNLVLELVDTNNADVRACFDFCKQNRMFIPDLKRCEPIGYDLKDECGKSNKWTVWDHGIQKIDCMDSAIAKQHNILLMQVRTLSRVDPKDPDTLICLDLDSGKTVSCVNDIKMNKHRGSSFLEKYDVLYYKPDGTQPHNALVIRRRSDSNFLTLSPITLNIGWEKSENRASPFVFFTELPSTSGRRAF